jgi:hypothetical protein
MAKPKLPRKRRISPAKAIAEILNPLHDLSKLLEVGDFGWRFHQRRALHLVELRECASTPGALLAQEQFSRTTPGAFELMVTHDLLVIRIRPLVSSSWNRLICNRKFDLAVTKAGDDFMKNRKPQSYPGFPFPREMLVPLVAQHCINNVPGFLSKSHRMNTFWSAHRAEFLSYGINANLTSERELLIDTDIELIAVLEGQG